MDKHLLGIVILNITFTIVIVLFYYIRPEEINSLFGYRTKRSMKNQASWDFAQRYFTKKWLLVLPMMYTSQLLLFWANFPYRTIGYSIVATALLGTCFIIYSTEQQLKLKGPHS